MFKNKYSGKFIAIEGLDGSGTTAQVQRLSQYFHSEKIHSLFTQEPTNNVIGGVARGCLTGDLKINSAVGLQLLFAADRANHLEKEIIPALQAGTNVITKRYFLSSIAYGSVQINDQDWLCHCSHLCFRVWRSCDHHNGNQSTQPYGSVGIDRT